jgi:hypothetical protein
MEPTPLTALTIAGLAAWVVVIGYALVVTWRRLVPATELTPMAEPGATE